MPFLKSFSCVYFGKRFGFERKKTWSLFFYIYIFWGHCLRTGDFQFPNDAYFLVSKLLIYTPMKYQTDLGGESASYLMEP